MTDSLPLSFWIVMGLLAPIWIVLGALVVAVPVFGILTMWINFIAMVVELASTTWTWIRRR